MGGSLKSGAVDIMTETHNTPHYMNAYTFFVKQTSQGHRHDNCVTSTTEYRGSNPWYTNAYEVTVSRTLGKLGTRSGKRAQWRSAWKPSSSTNFCAVARQREALLVKALKRFCKSFGGPCSKKEASLSESHILGSLGPKSPKF